VQKISPPPGFNPWTIQPVVSHYTDWAILAHIQWPVCSLSICGLFIDAVYFPNCLASNGWVNNEVEKDVKVVT
jgi:hypothetical protein